MLYMCSVTSMTSHSALALGQGGTRLFSEESAAARALQGNVQRPPPSQMPSHPRSAFYESQRPDSTLSLRVLKTLDPRRIAAENVPIYSTITHLFSQPRSLGGAPIRPPSIACPALPCHFLLVLLLVNLDTPTCHTPTWSYSVAAKSSVHASRS